MANIDWLREDEIRYRSRGLFEAAVRSQRLADVLDAGDDFPPNCAFFDRGALGPITVFEQDGMALVAMPQIGRLLALTPDRAANLAVSLLDWLEDFLPPESAK